MRFRHEGSGPICLYIDSVGGSVFYAQRILDLITTPDQKGHVPRLISVAIGFAASAAADLLALGDYAIAYPYSVVHYHGTRQSSDEITVDNIRALEASLRETNENFAVRLATRMFHRLITRMLQIRREESPNFLFHETISDPVSIFQKLKDKVSKEHKELIENALSKSRKLAELIGYIEKKDTGGDQRNDSDLLKTIIDFEMAGKAHQAIPMATLDSIREDFFQLKNYFHERYWMNLMDIVEQRGEYFLNPTDRNEFDSIDSVDKKSRIEFLLDKVAPKLSPVWYLVLSLCRCLQEGEHPISATDAYWLGLVDEVVGSSLTNLRVLGQSSPRPKAPVTSPMTSSTV